MRAVSRSDRGLVRADNEDSVYAGARVLAVADGMGGHVGGEVASRLMITALADLDANAPEDDSLAALAAAVHSGNAAIAAHIETSPDLQGMGTTVTAMLFDDNGFGLVHVGDSRAYRLRDGALTRLTRDDTFVQSLVDGGYITAEEARTHPRRSLIMNAATGATIELAPSRWDCQPGDRYLLCSDGLSDVVDDTTLATTLAEGEVPDCAERLIMLARVGGGPDNITVVVAEIPSAAE